MIKSKVTKMVATTDACIDLNNDSGHSVAYELLTQSGVRAVSAWMALKERRTSDFRDSEGPYELRDCVGDDLGWEDSHESLDPALDIDAYERYLEMRDEYGREDWPIKSLTHYLESENAPEPALKAEAVWSYALAKYAERKYVRRIESLAADHRDQQPPGRGAGRSIRT